MCGVCVYERERHTDRQRLISKMRPDDFMKKRMINVRSEFIGSEHERLKQSICSIILSNFKRHKERKQKLIGALLSFH